MKFCTAINCMDGRVQLPVIEYLRRRFKVPYVDMITEPGPNLILAQHSDSTVAQSIVDRVRISLEKHRSAGIAIIGHHDCAGNPATEEQQNVHTREAVNLIKQKFSDPEVIGLWLDENGQIWELEKK